jgi:hypothetical protein
VQHQIGLGYEVLDSNGIFFLDSKSRQYSKTALRGWVFTKHPPETSTNPHNLFRHFTKRNTRRIKIYDQMYKVCPVFFS